MKLQRSDLLTKVVSTARSSERAAEVLLVWVFSAAAVVAFIDNFRDASPLRLLLALVLVSALFVLRSVLYRVRLSRFYWGLTAAIWLAAVSGSLLSGKTASPLFPGLFIAVLYALVFLNRRAALFFLGLTAAAAVVMLSLPEAFAEPPLISYQPNFWILMVGGAVFPVLASLYAARRDAPAAEAAAHSHDHAGTEAGSTVEMPQLLNLYLDLTDEAVFLVDASDRIQVSNRASAELLGRPPDRIAGQPLGDFVRIRAGSMPQPPADSKDSPDAQPIFEGEFQHADGRSIPVEIRSALAGESGFYLVTARDRTQHLTLDRARTESQSKLAALLEHIPDGILLLGLDAKVLEANDQVSKMLGCGREDLIGQPLDGWLPGESLTKHRSRYNTVLEEGRALEFEQRLVRQNGREFPVEWNIALVQDLNGQPLHIQVILRDLSHRKRVDVERGDLLDNLRIRTRQIQTAFEVSKSISSTLDFNKLLNQTVEIIKQRFDFYYVGVFLVEDEQAVLSAGSGEPGKTMLSAGHRLPVGPSSMVGWCIENRRARIALDVGKDPVRFDNPLTPKTRSELAMPLIQHGEAIGALTVQSEYPAAFNSEDVAILQIMADQLAVAVQNARLHEKLADYASELEDRVLQRTFQLEELNRELESFSYSISHDLRTPLRAIHGYSNIVLEADDSEVSDSVRSYLEKIKANALRMGNLIDDILAFARMGRQALRRSALNPNALVTEVLEDLKGDLSRRHMDLRVDPLPSVVADPALLKQVFANLIGNAVKFTGQKENAAIHISCMDGESGKTVFFVADNGVGFDMRYADRLFGVFQRLHRPDEFEGTGVGLAIVQRIIHRHGGDVWVEAEEGRGATFYFSLPLVEP